MSLLDSFAAFVVAMVVGVPWAWHRGRAFGYREGLHDKHNVINNVYGPGWESRLIAHERCSNPSPLAGDPTEGT